MNKSIEIVTDRILALMEQGEIPWARPWRGDAHAPRNAVSDRSYSGINAFLLTMANYSNNRFVTFKQALELGGNVKKGEHGWPVIYMKQLLVEDRETGELKDIPFCKHYTVFNVSQCENLPEKFNEPVQVADNPVIRTCAEVVDNMPGRPDIVLGFNQAAYCRGTDQVEMPSLGQFDSSQAYYDTLFHELAHSTGHQSRIGRFQPGVMNKFGSKEYGTPDPDAVIRRNMTPTRTGLDRVQERALNRKAICRTFSSLVRPALYPLEVIVGVAFSMPGLRCGQGFLEGAKSVFPQLADHPIA
jgi:antirestriction protein ArdC